MKLKLFFTLFSIYVILFLQGCGIGGYHFSVSKPAFYYSGKFKNSENLNLSYKIIFPYRKYGDSAKLPLFLFIDGSGPFPLDFNVEGILYHYSSKGFVTAAKQKRGVAPSEGNFSELTFEERIQDNLDFIDYLLKQYPEIDSEKIYILGNSEGASVEGVVAYRYKKTAGLIWSSACLNEDWYDVIASNSHKNEKELLEKIRNGNDLNGKLDYYSKKWWYQHFNHKHFPELMEFSSPILFIFGNQDEEYPPFEKRFKEMLDKGKTNISLFVASNEGHGLQPQSLSIIDQWLENILK